MNEAVALEALLARLYTDEMLRRAFLADPLAVARAQGLGEGTARALCNIDRDGLELNARSLAATRAGSELPPDRPPE